MPATIGSEERKRDRDLFKAIDEEKAASLKCWTTFNNQ